MQLNNEWIHATSINTWVTAMDNFQTAGGVIVAQSSKS